jgi:hypothetical protein
MKEKLFFTLACAAIFIGLNTGCRNDYNKDAMPTAEGTVQNPESHSDSARVPGQPASRDSARTGSTGYERSPTMESGQEGK